MIHTTMHSSIFGVLLCCVLLSVKSRAIAAHGVTDTPYEMQVLRHKDISRMRAMLVTDEACFDELGEENSFYLYFGGGTDPTFFMYYEDHQKDLSSYYDYHGTTYDFTELLDHFKAPCEHLGGTLYSISGTKTCAADAGSPEVTHIDTNFPFCAPKGCTVDKASVEGDFVFDYCEPGGTLEKDYQVEVVDVSILGEECKEQMYLLESESIGPFYVESTIDWDSYEAEVEGEEIIYDFNTALEDYIGPCEEAGGYLYKMSDVITGNGYGYYAEGNVVLDYPICLGSSCVAEVYFDELYVPTRTFLFEGNFWDVESYNENERVFNGNGTYPAEQGYEFIGYEAVFTIPPPQFSGHKSIALTQFAFLLSLSLTLLVFCGFISSRLGFVDDRFKFLDVNRVGV
jgi:hypothetical protein